MKDDEKKDGEPSWTARITDPLWKPLTVSIVLALIGLVPLLPEAVRLASTIPLGPLFTALFPFSRTCRDTIAEQGYEYDKPPKVTIAACLIVAIIWLWVGAVTPARDLASLANPPQATLSRVTGIHDDGQCQGDYCTSESWEMTGETADGGEMTLSLDGGQWDRLTEHPYTVTRKDARSYSIRLKDGERVTVTYLSGSNQVREIR